LGQTYQQIKKVLADVLRVQPGEGTKTFLMFGLLMCIVGAFIMGRVARDSLFLSRYPIDYLPYLYIWVAVGTSIQSYLYSRIADRFRRDRMLLVTLATVGSLFVIARISMYWVDDWFYPVLYVFVEIVGTLMIIQAWTLANDVFNTREAKRLFGLIGAGGVISSVIVGLSVRGAIKVIGTEELLLLCAAVLVISLFIVHRLSHTCRQEIISSLAERTKSTKTRIALISDWRRIVTNRQLVFMSGLIMVLGLVITLVDYQFKITVQKEYIGQEEKLAGFFGMFWAISGIISCFIQFFLTSRILDKLGVLFSLMLLPAAFLASTISLLLKPGLWSATFLKGGDSTLRYTINDATMQLLYLPVPAHFRGRAKAFIDGIVRPVSIGLSGVLLAWFLKNLGSSAIGWLLVGLVFFWLIFAIGSSQHYFKSLKRTLKTRRFHFGEVRGIIPDEAASKILKEALDDKDEKQVLHALDMTMYSTNVDWTEDLLRLANHSSATVRARALKIIGDKGSLQDGPVVFEHLRDPSSKVRAAAVEAYCSIGKDRAIRIIMKFLNDRSTSVRAAAVIGLIRYGGLDGVLSSAEKLKQMLESEKSVERATGARILGSIGVKNFYHPLLSLLTDAEIKVRIAAIQAAGKMGSAELLPALVYRLEYADTRAYTIEALANFGLQAINILERVLENPKELLETRLSIPPILAKIAEQPAMDVLIKHINEPVENLRSKILESIHRLRVQKPHLAIAEENAKRGVWQEIEKIYKQHLILSDLNLPDNNILNEALQYKQKQTWRRLFRLLGCIFPVRTVDAVYANLWSGQTRARANAIEVLDNMLDKELKRLLLPLVDNALAENFKTVATEQFKLVSKSYSVRLTELIHDSDEWLATCAISTAGETDNKELSPEITKCTNSKHALVRETSLAILRTLLPDNQLRDIARQHSKDKSTNVRNYAQWLVDGYRSGQFVQTST
jgi:ATP/ADP translocase/HEAT repeat protein